MSTPRDTPLEQTRRFLALLHAATPRVWVTQALLAVNVGLFALMAANGAGVLRAETSVHLEWGANFAPLTAGGEWWRLVSACFVHFGIVHLAANMWALWDAGRVVERMFGNLPFALLYLASGVTGSVASLLWNPGNAISGGASGAVFGVIGALAAFIVLHRDAVPRYVLGRLRASLIAFVAISLAFGFTVPGIDNAAHLGGLASGVLLGVLLARPLGPDTRGPALPRMALTALAAAVLLLAGVSQVPAPQYDWRLEEKLHEELVHFVRDEAALLGEWQRVAKLRKEGRLDDARMADRIALLSAGWDAAYTRLSKLELSPGSPSRERLGLLIRYAGLQRDSALALSEALRTHDRAHAAEFLAIQAEIESIRAALKQAAQAGAVSAPRAAPPGSSR